MITSTTDGRGDRRCYRQAVVPLVALAMLWGCTDGGQEQPEPAPLPAEEASEEASLLGARVAVVLPPRTDLDTAAMEQLQEQVSSVGEAYGTDIRSVRAVAPETDGFVRDVAALLVRDGAGLTCILGASGPSLARELRELHPDRRFCAITSEEPPAEPTEGVDVVALRTAEVGHLLGAVAADLAGEGTVLLALGPTQLQEGPFIAGLEAGLGPAPPAVLDREVPVQQAVAAAVAEGATVLIVGTGPGSRPILDAGLASGMTVIAHTGIVEEGDAVAVTWDVSWSRALSPALDRLLGVDQPAPLSYGLREGIFRTELGPAADEGLEVLLKTIRKQLVDGDRDPLVPVEPEQDEEEDELDANGTPEEDPGGDEAGATAG